MRQDLGTGKVAASLVNQLINAGAVQQTGEHEISVPHPDGDKVFTAFQDN